MRDTALQTPDTSRRREFRRRAAANVWMAVSGAALALLFGGFVALALWAERRSGGDVTDALFSHSGVLALIALALSLTIAGAGLRRMRLGEAVALILAPEGVALPEQSVPVLPWPSIVAADRTHGRGARLRLFVDRETARVLRPHGVWRVLLRLANLHPRDALSVTPQGLAVGLDDLLALVRAYVSAHGGPRPT